MKRDKLETQLFKDNKGQEYRKAEHIDLEASKNFLQSKGFKVEDLKQTWRCVHGVVQKDGIASFFKMGSTAGICDRIRNEVSFNTGLNEEISKRGITNFVTPNIGDTGKYGDLFYYIADYYPGPLLLNSSQDKPDAEFEGNLEQVVDINMSLLEMPKLDLPRDQEFSGKSEEDCANRMIEIYSTFAKQVEELGMDELVEVLEEFRNNFKFGLNHGDFTPWHLIKNDIKSRWVLIDSEHASNNDPKFYDIAYFYHRLYTSSHGADGARRYLDLIKARLGGAEKIEEFKRSIRPILAARIIGGYWDAKTAGESDYRIHNQLKQEFLSGKTP